MKVQGLAQDSLKDKEQKTRWEESKAKRLICNQRATDATLVGAEAFDRLLCLAESRQSGQIRRIALFIGACWNGCRHFDFYDFRSLDVEIGDDMMAVLDALRWAKVSVEDLAPNGYKRIVNVLEIWGMYGVDQTGQLLALPPGYP